jgi:hypothetical protein
MRQKKDRCIGLDASRDNMTDCTTERVSTSGFFLCAFNGCDLLGMKMGRYKGSSGEILPTLVRLGLSLVWSDLLTFECPIVSPSKPNWMWT